jgi:hypothetical protein
MVASAMEHLAALMLNSCCDLGGSCARSLAISVPSAPTTLQSRLCSPQCCFWHSLEQYLRRGVTAA